LPNSAGSVEHLTERISGSNDDGTPKVFRDSAVGNLADFFARFRNLNVRSNPQLDALVEEAQRTVRGLEAQDLRDSATIRQFVGERLANVRTSLDAMLIERPGGGSCGSKPRRRTMMDLIVEPIGVSARSTMSRSISRRSAFCRSVAPVMSSPDAQGRWHTDLSLVSGPVLGPFALRSAALEAEHAWLNQHLGSPRGLESLISVVTPRFHSPPCTHSARTAGPPGVRAGAGRGSRGHHCRERLP